MTVEELMLARMMSKFNKENYFDLRYRNNDLELYFKDYQMGDWLSSDLGKFLDIKISENSFKIYLTNSELKTELEELTEKNKEQHCLRLTTDKFKLDFLLSDLSYNLALDFLAELKQMG